MATQKGILQALWGEVRPAVEARRPDLCRSLVRLVNRGRAIEAIALWTSALAERPEFETQALGRLARRHGVDLPEDAAADTRRARTALRTEAFDRPIPALQNCRLLMDGPHADRIWLHRGGSWKLYRFDGARFLGTPLSRVEAEVEAGGFDPADCLMELRLEGRACPNPKLASGR